MSSENFDRHQEFCIDDLEDDDLFCFSNFTPDRTTGLDYIIWAGIKVRDTMKYPVLKVQVNNYFVPVTISDNPEWLSDRIKIPLKNFKKIKLFIKMNKDSLMKFWNSKGKMGCDELAKLIIAIRKGSKK